MIQKRLSITLRAIAIRVFINVCLWNYSGHWFVPVLGLALGQQILKFSDVPDMELSISVN